MDYKVQTLLTATRKRPCFTVKQGRFLVAVKEPTWSRRFNRICSNGAAVGYAVNRCKNSDLSIVVGTRSPGIGVRSPVANSIRCFEVVCRGRVNCGNVAAIGLIDFYVGNAYRTGNSVCRNIIGNYDLAGVATLSSNRIVGMKRWACS